MKDNKSKNKGKAMIMIDGETPEERSKNRRLSSALSGLSSVIAGPIGGAVHGLAHGKDTRERMTGLTLGSNGIEGMRAKSSGESGLSDVVVPRAIIGGVAGLGTGLVMSKSIPLGLVGMSGGLAGGAVSGLASYGLGHLIGPSE